MTPAVPLAEGRGGKERTSTWLEDGAALRHHQVVDAGAAGAGALVVVGVAALGAGDLGARRVDGGETGHVAALDEAEVAAGAQRVALVDDAAASLGAAAPNPPYPELVSPSPTLGGVSSSEVTSPHPVSSHASSTPATRRIGEHNGRGDAS